MLDSGLPEEVGNEEELGRFLTQRSQFKRTVARPAAFLPDRKSRETSVSRHERESLERLWERGEKAAGKRTLYGVVFISAGQVRSAGLDVEADEPPERHAAIRGWPWLDDDPVEQKSQQKEIAIELASMASAPLLKP